MSEDGAVNGVVGYISRSAGAAHSIDVDTADVHSSHDMSSDPCQKAGMHTTGDYASRPRHDGANSIAAWAPLIASLQALASDESLAPEQRLDAIRRMRAWLGVSSAGVKRSDLPCKEAE